MKPRHDSTPCGGLSGTAAANSWLPIARPVERGSPQRTVDRRLHVLHTMPAQRPESRAPGQRRTPMTADHHRQTAPVFAMPSDTTVDHALDAKPWISASHLQRGPAYRHSSRTYPGPADRSPGLVWPASPSGARLSKSTDSHTVRMPSCQPCGGDPRPLRGQCLQARSSSYGSWIRSPVRLIVGL